MERLALVQHHCQGRRHLQRIGITLLLVTRQQLGKRLKTTALQLHIQLRHEALLAHFIDFCGVRQWHFFHFLASHTFNGLQQALVFRRDKQDRITFATGTTGTADTVHIGFCVKRNVIVNHMTDARHIQASRHHVGGHQDIDAAVLQLLDGLLSLGLRNITVQCRHLVADILQCISQLHGAVLGAGKHNDAIEGFGFEHARQGIKLVAMGNEQVTLANRRDRLGLRLDGNFFRVFQVLLRQAANRRWHGGGEQSHLAVVWRRFHHGFDVFDKAHAQHLVSFVEHQAGQGGKIERALGQVVNHPARGTDDKLDAITQCTQLRTVIHATTEADDAHVRILVAVTAKGFRHLQCQFARRRQHQYLDKAGLEMGEAGNQRQGKGSGFTGTGLRLADNITAGQHMRNHLRLDRRRGLVTKLAQGIEHRRSKAKAVKARLGHHIRHVAP